MIDSIAAMQSQPVTRSESAATNERPAMAFAVSLLLIVAASAALRFAAADCDLWFDEIWTLRMIADDAGSSGVLGPAHNNNHPLNTWVLRLTGEQPSFVVNRLHSVLAGIGTVAMAALIGLRRGRAEALLAAVLVGASYMQIHYSTEARGYSMMVFFVFVAFYALHSWLRAPAPLTLMVFWSSCVLATLAHLFSTQFFLAAGLWSLAFGAGERSASRRIRDAALLFGPIALFLLWLYANLVGIGEELLGAAVPTGPHAPSVIQAISLAVGGPADAGAIATLLAGLAALGLGAGILWLPQDREREWIFYTLVCFGSPAIFLWLNDPWALFARYFLISIAFYAVLLGFVLARLARTRTGQIAAAAILAGYLLGNARHVALLLEYGHGQYLAALQYMASASPDGLVRVGSDHPFRNGMLIDFYAARISDASFQYVEEGEGAPEWFIVHHAGSLAGTGMQAFDYAERRYELDRIFRTTDLAGFDWRIYRRVDAPPR